MTSTGERYWTDEVLTSSARGVRVKCVVSQLFKCAKSFRMLAHRQSEGLTLETLSSVNVRPQSTCFGFYVLTNKAPQVLKRLTLELFKHSYGLNTLICELIGRYWFCVR